MSFLRLAARASSRQPGARRASAAPRPAIEALESRLCLTVPYLLASGARVVEGTGTNSSEVFVLNLSGPSTDPVSVDYRTVDRTAQAGLDYVAAAGTVTFAPGETTKSVTVAVIGDSVVETTETFGLSLSNARNATLTSTQVIGTILDDDTPVAAQLSINDVQMIRGLSGTRTMLFTVSLSAPATSTVSVLASTADMTAQAGKDYQGTSSLLTFNPGERTKTFAVTIYGTATPTSDKVFTVNLTGGTVPIARKTGAGILKYGA